MIELGRQCLCGAGRKGPQSCFAADSEHCCAPIIYPLTTDFRMIGYSANEHIYQSIEVEGRITAVQQLNNH